ncbi:MAG: hypothetical protein K0S28_915 [Paucimonas sp.]|jgi:hypothetical protein|nr:hypothetical protein [Paucimonas sp.]
MSRSRALRLAVIVAAVLTLVTAWAMVAPVQVDSREQLFEIPAGTWERRTAGNKVDILPSEIYLTLKVRDILVLRNLDKVPQIFGPVLIMPGQSFKLPFNLASDYQFECTAHASGQMTVIVDPEPVAGWGRLTWRLKSAIRFLKNFWQI